MLQVISSIQPKVDAEYLMILQELRRFGIAPSGNKSTDRMKLEQAKAELINKIAQKSEAEKFENTQVEVIQPIDETENAKRSEMELQRLGAMNIAELNRIYFKI